MGAGLIYAGIVAAWAIVLAPAWIRRSDERFDPLMAARSSAGVRVLTRRPRRGPAPSAPSGRPTAPPATTRSARYGDQPAARTRVARVAARPPVRQQAQPPPKPQRALARTAKRRQFVISMAVAVIGLGVAVALAAAPVWAPALPTVALAGYVIRVRGEARRAYERTRRARMADARRAEARRRAEAIVAAAPPASAERRQRPALVNPDGTWQPVKIPLPSYVTAPVAGAGRRDSRPIVLGAYGSWTRRRMGDLMRHSRTAGGRPLLVPVAADEAAVLPRAVNE